MQKLLFIFSFFFPLSVAYAQPCTIQTKYSNDGLAIKFIPTETIDSTADLKCSLGLQYSSRYNYISLSLLFKNAVKRITSDLVVKFTDSSTIYVPLTNCNYVNPQNLPLSNCTFLVLDKYVDALKTKSLSAIIIQMADNSFKAIEMKQHPAILKNAIVCLNP